MKGLTTLIKLHKRRLDDLRRQMGSFESQKTQLRQAAARAREELAAEMELGKKQADMARFFGDFAKRMQKRQEEIATEIASLDQQMKELADVIAEAFAELKKFELAKEMADRRAAEEANRKETLRMDEIAAQQHRRKEEAE